MNKKSLRKKRKIEVKQSKSQKFSLEWLGHWATILSFLTSSFFAVYAIYLSNRQEETDKKVGLLEGILCVNQDLLLSNHEIQLSNKFLLDELIKQGKTQNTQLNYLAKNNETVSNQYSILKDNKQLDDQTSDLEFNDLIMDFFDLTYYFRGGYLSKNEFLALPINEKLELLSKFELSIMKLRQNKNLIREFQFRWQLGVFEDFGIKFYRLILQMPDDKNFKFELNGTSYSDKKLGQIALYDWFRKMTLELVTNAQEYQKRQFEYRLKLK